MKIAEKVSFNIASEASYILSGQKLIKNAKKSLILASFWKTLRTWGQIVLPDRSLLRGQKLMKNATNINFGDFFWKTWNLGLNSVTWQVTFNFSPLCVLITEFIKKICSCIIDKLCLKPQSTCHWCYSKEGHEFSKPQIAHKSWKWQKCFVCVLQNAPTNLC